MKSIFSAALSLLPVVAASPLALVGLIIVTLAATVLFWKQAGFRSLAKTVEVLPEKDRLERIRLDYGVQPKGGIGASDWLRAQRQERLFWAYVSTLLMVLLGVIVLYGRLAAVPGGTHREELRGSYAALHDKLEAYEFAARNLRDGFLLAGENAIAPDKITSDMLTDRVTRYNAVYGDLRTNQKHYLEPILRWLGDWPDLANQVSSLVDYALEEVHLGGLLEFNAAAYRRSQQLRALAPDERTRQIGLIRASGSLEIHDLATKVDGRLEVFTRRLQSVTATIMGS